MAFAQLTYRESLRDIEVNLRAQAKRLYHMGFRCATLPRNTLANRHQDIAGNLSGGQQQMLAIARASLGCPKLLMLDEPSLGLASLIIKEIYSTLSRLRENGLTVLLVEQNANMAIRFADHSVVLSNGKIVMQGTRDELLSNGALAHHSLGVRTASR